MKKRLPDILCKITGAILHPLLMPTYGILLFCAVLGQTMPLPTAYWLIAVLGTFTLTAVIPMSLIIIRLFAGTISNIEIRNASERTPIYIYSIVCYIFWGYFLLKVLHAPIVLFLIATGATMSLIGVTVINRRWKISAHLTGIGGLIGGICAYCLNQYLALPLGLIAVLLSLALILMYSRIYMKAHTPHQVVAGLLWGLTMTSLPTLIYNLI